MNVKGILQIHGLTHAMNLEVMIWFYGQLHPGLTGGFKIFCSPKSCAEILERSLLIIPHPLELKRLLNYYFPKEGYIISELVSVFSKQCTVFFVVWVWLFQWHVHPKSFGWRFLCMIYAALEPFGGRPPCHNQWTKHHIHPLLIHLGPIILWERTSINHKILVARCLNNFNTLHYDHLLWHFYSPHVFSNYLVGGHFRNGRMLRRTRFWLELFPGGFALDAEESSHQCPWTAASDFVQGDQ